MLAFEKTDAAYTRKVRWVILGIIALGLLMVKITPVEVMINLKEGNNIFERQANTCSMLNIFGIPCALCGMSRGFQELAHFNFAASIYYNPFSVIFYPLGFLSIAVIFVASFYNYRVKIVKPKIFWWGIFFLFAIVWIVNIIWGHH